VKRGEPRPTQQAGRVAHRGLRRGRRPIRAGPGDVMGRKDPAASAASIMIAQRAAVATYCRFAFGFRVAARARARGTGLVRRDVIDSCPARAPGREAMTVAGMARFRATTISLPLKPPIRPRNKRGVENDEGRSGRLTPRHGEDDADQDLVRGRGSLRPSRTRRASNLEDMWSRLALCAGCAPPALSGHRATGSSAAMLGPVPPPPAA